MHISFIFNRVLKYGIIKLTSADKMISITDRKTEFVFSGQNFPLFHPTDIICNDGVATPGNMGSKVGYVNISRLNSNTIEFSLTVSFIDTPILFRATSALILY